MSVVREARALASRVYHRLRPTPAEAAWRRIVHEAERSPRYTAGRARLLGLDLEYPDATSLAPQWHDLFVRETLAFAPGTDAPRVLDCGANVGLATLWIRRAFPRARVTAFEADPRIAQTLRANLDRNGCADVEVVAAAAWREAGTLLFRREGSDSGAVDEVGADTEGERVRVPAVRLRDWVADDHVDLLKLDVEGAERVLLVDLAVVLDRVRALHVEVHDFDPARRLLPACLERLSAAGFTYALDDFAVADWRKGTRPPGPFRHARGGWVVLARAWREAP
ncbi:MAG: FkbM family methyltransferase [Vicinamibacterales bacterium]